MSLADKYGIPQAVVTALYKDGKLTYAAKRKDEIEARLAEIMAKGLNRTSAITSLSEEMKLSERMIYNYLKD